MESAYAQALWELVEKGASPRDAVHKIHSLLQQHGREGLMPRIASAFERIADERRRAEGVTLSVARHSDLARAHREVKHALAEHGKGTIDGAEEVVDESLIGGWRLEGKETLLDASFKNHLLTLYNRLTTS